MARSCPSTERLAAALQGGRSGGDDADLADHLTECSTCQAKLERLAGGSGWMEAKARTQVVHAGNASEALQQAMRRLESRSGISEHEVASAPNLDFLQPSGQPGVLGQFGAYEVIAHVASGGMGIVLKARDPGLNRIVALKILPPALAANALARARFVREARAAAAVVHEHVVPIYAVDESAGLPFIVMQFIQGRALSERIHASGPMRLEEILRIGAQTAAGLAAAHAQGLIHRDVKPANILLENSVERVKLTDFGLARATDDTGLTRTGELAGTPEFMAPEQAGNERVDHRADLFSLGTVLYAMCTGISPFAGSSVAAAIRNVCDKQPPRVHEIDPVIPRWLSDIVARLMAKAPAERFQSAQEVAELLERHLAQAQHGEPAELPNAKSRSKARGRIIRRAVMAAAAGVVLLGVCIFLWKAPHSDTMNSASLAPFLVLSETGTNIRAFTNITDALTAVPSGGVVELRWNGSREMPPVTLPTKPLTLRAAKGFHPAWIHTNLSVSALTASRALTMEDIEMSLHPDATAVTGRPAPRPRMIRSGVGLIIISNAPFRLSRCVLQLPDPRLQPRGSQLGGAGLSVIILNNVAACELENSALLGAPWDAIKWRETVDQNATVADYGSQARLSLSNCVVTAFMVFNSELAENSHPRLQMIRCAFRAHHLIQFPEASAGRRLTVIAQTNLFLTGAMVVDGRSPTREVLTASMRWQGRGNLFDLDTTAQRAGAYVVLGRGARESWPGTLSEWNQWWPEPETGSREATVTFADAANVPASGSFADFVRAAFKIERLSFSEGPPLEREQWAHFGVDTDNVGPASR